MKKLLALVLTIAFVFSCSAIAFAQTTQSLPIDASTLQTSPVCLYGQVGSIGDQKMEVIPYPKTTPNAEKISLSLSQGTYFIDAVSGLPLAQKPKKGDAVAVYYGPAVAESSPLQSNVVAVIANVPQDYGFPNYAKVEAVSRTAEGIKITTDNGTRVVTLGKDMPITPFKTKNIVTLDQIKVGSEVVLWYNIMTMSLPGFATAEKAVLLNSGEALADTISVFTSTGEITVNGKALALKGQVCYEKNGTVLLPLRPITDSVGMHLTWIEDTNSIRLQKEFAEAFLTVGSQDYNVNHQNYKATLTPEFKNNTTYVPAEMLEKILDIKIELVKK